MIYITIMDYLSGYCSQVHPHIPVDLLKLVI